MTACDTSKVIHKYVEEGTWDNSDYYTSLYTVTVTVQYTASGSLQTQRVHKFNITP